MNSYLRDEARPKPEWLREAAEVLMVRSEWLLSGDGAPTREEEELEETIEGMSFLEILRRKKAGEWNDVLDRQFRSQVGESSRRLGEALRDVDRQSGEIFTEAVADVFPEFWSLPDSSRVAVVNTRSSLIFLNGEESDYADMPYPEAIRELGRQVGGLLRRAFDLVGSTQLGPIETALAIDSVLRPIEIAKHVRKSAHFHQED